MNIRVFCLGVLAFCGAGNAQPNPTYSYSIPTDGFSTNGNIVRYTDSVTGSWEMTYDNLNRLGDASATAGPFSGVHIHWGYDAFGNRTEQTPSGSSAIVPAAWSATYNSSNQLVSASAGSSPTYDAAGNMTFDGAATHLAYDASNRVCASYSNLSSAGVTQYIYDAEGRRVAKGHSTDTSRLACPTDLTQFVVTERYVLGLGGEQVTELDGAGNWKHTNVYAEGGLLASYDASGLHFSLTDPLGTVRVRFSGAGSVEENCASLPYGDGLSCTPQMVEPSEHHFTGKERDQESGLDYFGARYYSSVIGRFSSPDWSAKEEPVPYAKLDDPQTLNLYAYVGNNPLMRDDPDGHAFGLDDLVGATAGALIGMATEAIKDVATDQRITAGAMAGAAVGGAIFAEGIVNMPETLGGSVVAAAAVKGAAQGLVSNAVQQGVDNMTGDQKGFSMKSSAVSTGLGAATGGLASKMPEVKVPGITSGTGNMRSVAKGVATKIANGTASRMSLKTALKGAVGGQVANAGKTVAQTSGTAVTTSICNANTGGACK